MMYHKPKKWEEAKGLRKKDAVYLAGGTELNRAPLDRPTPKAVIDLRGLLSQDISQENDHVRIGAMTSLQDLADSTRVPSVLKEAAAFLPNRSIRNQATVGGNLGAGRADSYLIPVLMALSAVIHCSEGDLSLEEYLREGSEDLILDIKVPLLKKPCVVVKEARSHQALPVVSAAVSIDVTGTKIQGACVALGCVGAKTIRLSSIEKGLVSGQFKDRPSLEAAIAQEINPVSNILGSAQYKTYINSVLVARACWEIL